MADELKDIIVEAHMENLEKIVDDALEDFASHDKQNYSDIQEFAKYRKMERPPDGVEKMKEALTVESKLNKLHDSILTNRDISMQSENNIKLIATENNTLIKSVDSKFNKVIYALFVIFFLLGVFVGILDEVWKPYITDILNFTRASTNIMKG